MLNDGVSQGQQRKQGMRYYHILVSRAQGGGGGGKKDPNFPVKKAGSPYKKNHPVRPSNMTAN